MQGKVINGFELKSSLGRGGMAEVWYAENEIGKPAAVKVLKEDLSHNEQLVDRFRNEAIVMVKLDHPNIRQVYGYGTIDDRPCIVMEYLEGNDLKAMMKQGRRFTDEELKKWWNQLVDALNYTHAQGIIHRDIKPSNIFIDKKGDVKLLDFGIAKVKESISATQTGAMMGTLMYMSPEQVDDAKHLGPATDVYSLAVSFVHLLSGRAPYDTTKSSDFKIREGIVYNPLDMTGVPADWQAFLEPYLAKKSTDRPALRHFDTLPNLPKQKILEEDEGTITDEVVSPPKKKEKASSQAKLHDKPLPKKSHAGALSSKKTQEIQDTLSKPIDAVTEKPKGKYYAIALLSFTIVAFLFTLILGFTSSDFLTKYYTAVFDVLMYTLLAAIALSIVGFIRPNWLGLQCRKEVAKTYLLSLLFCLLAIMGVGNHKPETEIVELPEPLETEVVEESMSNEQVFSANGVEFKMVKVEGGTFQMGCDDIDASDNEKPVHNVTLSSFYMGETEVTQALWQAVMGSNPSHFKGDNLPVECASYNDIVNGFLPKLNSLTGKEFRLPTEAEWEYAARGGVHSNGYKYAGSDNVDDVAWYSVNSYNTPHVVKAKVPNELGLYDMSGNVWEWCQDWYGSDYYGKSPSTNPQGPSSGSNNCHVLRGGSWSIKARFCRVSDRSDLLILGPSCSNCNGFRLALSE